MKLCVSIYSSMQHVGYPTAEKDRGRLTYASARRLKSSFNINQTEEQESEKSESHSETDRVRSTVTLRKTIEVSSREDQQKVIALLTRWETTVENNNRQFRVRRQAYKDALAAALKEEGYTEGTALKDIPNLNAVRIRRKVKPDSFHYWKAQMVITKDNSDDSDGDFGIIKSRYGSFLTGIPILEGFKDTKKE